MIRKSLMSKILYSLGVSAVPSTAVPRTGMSTATPMLDDMARMTAAQPAKQKGQKRNTASKSSGAAQLKRNAKTRNNINKRKGK